MKLSVKLPLAFIAALLSLLAAALFGLYQLNGALAIYETSVRAQTDHERAVGNMLGDFRVQVQEWKNVLLRGKDPRQLQRYWSAFEDRERRIQQQAARLQQDLQGSDSAALVG